MTRLSYAKCCSRHGRACWLKSLRQVNDNTVHSLLLEAPQLPFRIVANYKVAQSHTQRTFRPSLSNRDRVAAALHALSPVLCFAFVVEGNLNHESFEWLHGAHHWLGLNDHISRLPCQSELLRGLLFPGWLGRSNDWTRYLTLWARRDF